MSNTKSRMGAMIAIFTLMALFGTLSAATAVTNIGTVTVNARRGAPEPPAAPAQNACKIDDSVALHTGEFIWSMSDLVLPGRGPDLVIAHTYKSGSNIRGRWGRGWHLSVDVRVLKLENGNLLLVGGDGQKHEFGKPETGSDYTPPPGVSGTLAENEDGTFTRATQAGDRYEFDEDGKLIRIEDRNGNGWRLGYAASTDSNMSVEGTSDFFMTMDSGLLAWTHQLETISSISDSDSRNIQFEYYSSGRLRSISGPGDYEMAYEYDTRGRLTHIVLPELSDAASGDTGAYRFVYENGTSRMTEVLDPEGLHIIRNAYDTAGRVEEQTNHGRTVMFRYAEEDNTTTVTRANGAVDEYVFNDRGNPVRIVLDKGDETLNLETRYEYDDRMNLTRLTDPEGTQTTYSYDSDGRLEEIVQDSREDGRRIETRYDYQDGRLSSIVGPRGNRTRFGYDGPGNLVHVEYETGKEIEFTYDDKGDLAKASTLGSSKTPIETFFSYDNNGFVKDITDSEGNKATFTYDAMGNVETFQDRNGLTLFHEHDNRSRLIKQGVRAAQGDKAVTRYRYMSNGRLREMIPPEGPAVTYSYDEHGRLTRIGDVSFEYGEDGHIASVTDARGGETRFDYDAANRPTRRESVVGDQTDPTIRYRYDKNNNLTEFIDAEDRSTFFSYDALDRLTEITYPDPDIVTRRAYDDAGNLSRMEDRTSNVFHYTYNQLDQLTELTFNNDGISNIYGGLINHLSKSVWTYNGNPHTITYNYTSLGQIELVQQGDYDVGYGYDPGGRQNRLAYPDEQYIEYHYDDLGHLSSITEANGDDIAVFEHDEAGRPTKKSLANGLHQQYSRGSDAHRVEKIENFRAAEPLSFSAIQYEDDEMGNPATVTRTVDDASQEYEYQYDPFYRLTRAEYSANTGLADAVFTYDAVGNRKTERRGGTDIAYTVNDLNQYTRVDGETHAYDANGNLKADPEHQYDYDPWNRLIGVDTDGANVVYGYDQNGRLISRRLIGSGATTTYIYDADRLIAEYSGQGIPIRKYVRHPLDGTPLRMTIVDDDTHYYYLTDRNGSVLAITGEAGEIVERYAYDAFGHFVIRNADGETIETSTVGNPFYFHGKRFDETAGLYIDGSRHYHPGLGRYLQPNPDGYDIAGNSYTYMNNNPFNEKILPPPPSTPPAESANPAEAMIRNLFSGPFVTVDPMLPRPRPTIHYTDPNASNVWTPPEAGTTIPYLIQMLPMVR